jgi:hypothetical protein
VRRNDVGLVRREEFLAAQKFLISLQNRVASRVESTRVCREE